jgi:hypothetical protein
MQSINVKPGQVFLLELEAALSENEKAALLLEWNKILPNNPIVITKKGSLSILTTD